MGTKETFSLVCVLVLSSAALGATLHWTGAGADKRWDNPANWENQKVPTSTDEAYIDVPPAAAPRGPVIRDPMAARALGLACEVAGEPNMAMTGGTLEIADWIWWGDGDKSHGTFRMSGGAITVAAEHELGWGGGEGTWIMTGGFVTADRLIIPTATGKAGQLYLHGGAYHVRAGGLRMTATGLLDITEGVLTLAGDQRAAVERFVNARQITGYGGQGYLETDYDERNLGMTTVTAVPITGKAYQPEPADGARNVTLPLLRWQAGQAAAVHQIYVGLSADALQLVKSQSQSGYWLAGFTPGTTFYWRIDEVEADSVTIHEGDVWSFTMAPATAHDPRPWDGAKWVDPQADLTWTAGLNAPSHDVYFGADRAAVEARDPSVFKGNKVIVVYDPGPLADDTTYYWRIDERAGAQVQEGPVWSFTTRGPGGGVRARYFRGKGLSGPAALVRLEDAIDHQWGSGEVVAGLSDMVSARWTANLEAPLTEAYTLITTSDDGVRLWLDGRLFIDNWTDHTAAENRARVSLVAGQVYSLRMEWYESTAAAVAQLSWQSASVPKQIIPAGPLQPPVRATSPYPAHTTPNAGHALSLRWKAGEDAAGHEVYFGADAQAVAAADTDAVGVYRGRQALNVTTFEPGELEWNKTYYWRVDEVNNVNADSPWQGVVWSFTTADFLVVDDFESYTDDEGGAIYQTWIDGWVNTNGSRVGYEEPPYAELKVVYGGWQSMPVDYNNAVAPFYSEAERQWPAAQDWTVNGVDTLVLYVQGKPGNGSASFYVALEDEGKNLGVFRHPDPALVKTARWVEWKVPLAQFTAAGVDVARVEKMYIGLGDKGGSTPGGRGLIFIDDIRVTRSAGR